MDRAKTESQEDLSFHGNRRKDLPCRRRYSLLRADYAGVVDACEKRPDYILRQFGFWLDCCRLDCGADVGNCRAERTADEFDFVDVVLLENLPSKSCVIVLRNGSLTYRLDGYSICDLEREG